jgi:hypothetical protein
MMQDKKEFYMKRYVDVVFLGLILVFLNACIGGPAVKKPNFDISVSTREERLIADITLDVSWQEGGIAGGLYHGIRGFSLQVANKTDDIISLVWSKSSLSYNGKSYLPFIDGQKYSESSKPQSPTVIPANGTTSISLFSSDQPYYTSPGGGYSGGWKLMPIETNEIIIILSIESDGHNIPFEIKVVQKQQQPE